MGNNFDLSLGVQEPPNDPMIYNRKVNGEYRPLSGFFEGSDPAPDEQTIASRVQAYVENIYTRDWPEDRYIEDPIARPTITVGDAYDLGILPFVKLFVLWQGDHDSEYNPPRRHVHEIILRGGEGKNRRFEVQASNPGALMVNTLMATNHLEMSISTVPEKLLYAAWMKLYKDLSDANDTIQRLTYPEQYLEEEGESPE